MAIEEVALSIDQELGILNPAKLDLKVAA